MKKIIIIISVLFLFSISFAQEKYEGQTIEKILELQEEEIDLGIACLVIAKEAYPNLNIAFFNYAINYMVSKIQFYNRENQDPESRIALLNKYLFVTGNWNDSISFTFDYDDMEGRKKDNRYLNGLIATKKGCCVTLPMLYLVLADRLGWPIYPVRAPQHFFCRYIVNQDSNKYYNIETTSKGMIIDNGMYIEDFKITEAGVRNGCYLRTLTKKEYLGSIIHGNLLLYRDNDGMVDLEKSGNCLTLALSCDTLNCEAHWAMGRICQLQAKHYSRLMDNELAYLVVEQNSKARSSDPYDLSTPEEIMNQNKKNQERIRNMMSPHQNKSKAQDRFGLLPEPMVVQPQLNPVPAPKSNQRSDMEPSNYDHLTEITMSKYSSAISYFKNLSEWHENMAKELGMVFETTREFYLRKKDKKTSNELENIK